MFDEADDYRAEEVRGLRNIEHKIFTWQKPLDAELTLVYAETFEYSAALADGMRYGVRYTDLEGEGVSFFKRKESALALCAWGIFTSQPEVFEL